MTATIDSNLTLTVDQNCLAELDRTRRGDINFQRKCLVDDWATRHGLTPNHRREWWRMIGKRYDRTRPDRLPGDDHVMEFTTNGRTAVHVSQPYGLDATTISDMDRAAELYGLQYAILAQEAGWWNPGRTHFIAWTRRGDPILQKIVEGAR